MLGLAYRLYLDTFAFHQKRGVEHADLLADMAHGSRRYLALRQYRGAVQAKIASCLCEARCM